MSLNTSPLSGSKGTTGSGLPKLTKLGGGLSKGGSSLPKLGSSGLKSLSLGLKKKDAPAADAPKEEPSVAEDKKETETPKVDAPKEETAKADAPKEETAKADAPKEETAKADEAKPAEDVPPVPPASVPESKEEEEEDIQDLGSSSISMLMPDISAFLAADEDEEEKTSVQSTDEFLGHLLGGASDKDEWSLDGFDKTTKVPMNIPSTRSADDAKHIQSDIPKMPDVPSVNIDTTGAGVSSIKLTTPSVEMPASTTKVDPSVAISAPDAPSLSPEPPKEEDVATTTLAQEAANAAQEAAATAQEAANAAQEAAATAQEAANAAQEAAATAQAESVPAAPSTPPAPKMTPEEEMLSLMTPEERQAYEQEKMLEEMTPEERQAYEEQLMLDQMTPEEREAYALEKMTPEERQAYEQEKAKALADEEIRKQTKREEMYKNYMLDQQNAPKKGSIMPFVIVCLIAIAAAVFGFIYWQGQKAEEQRIKAELEQARLEAEAAAAAPKQNVSDYELQWYNVSIDCPAGATLYVNGVEIKSGDQTKFVKDHANTVIAYLDGMVPFFKSYTKDDPIPDTIKVEFESDQLYMKTNVELKLKNASIKGYDLKVTFDGRSLPSLPDELHDVVMGRPHILILEKPGFAPHLHMFWPTKIKGSTKARVTLPALETVNNAQGGSILNTKDFPSSPEPYGIWIHMADTIWQSPTSVNAPHGAFVEYAITRKQRIPLNLGIYPDKYGSVTFDTDLLQDPLGHALVSFKPPKGAKKDALDNIQICFRREGVCICPDMKAETEIPSGPDWKVIGYLKTSDTKEILRNEYGQDIKAKRGYIFSPKVNKGSLVIDPPEWRVIDDNNSNKKK